MSQEKPPENFQAGEELEHRNRWTELAQKYWSQPAKSRKVNSEVIKNEIWDILEREEFLFRSLLLLENLQLLEKYDISIYGY